MMSKQSAHISLYYNNKNIKISKNVYNVDVPQTL